MKRKFILYPAVALALMTSASLSSCVDTDEPDSLADLREAVAAREKAQAGYIDAKSEVEKAYVAVVNAKARLDEANAVAQELANALTEVKNATTKLEQQIKQDSLAGDKDNRLAAAKAIAEAELQYAQKRLDEAKKDYQNAVRDNQTEIEKNIRTNEEALAHLNAYGLEKSLKDALDNVATAEKNLADAQAALEYEIKIYNVPENLQGDIDDAKKALATAKTAKAKVEKLLDADHYDAIIAEWKDLKEKEDEYKVVAREKEEEQKKLDLTKNEAGKLLPEAYNELVGKKNAAQDALNKFNSWDANTEGSIAQANKKKNDLIEAIKNSTSNIVASFNDEKVDITFDCKNDALNKMVEADKPSDFAFTFDSKNKRWIKTQVKRSEIETTVQSIRALFFSYGDPLGYNELAYKKIANKYTDALAAAKNKIVKYDDGAVVNAYDKWKASITALRNAANETKHGEALVEFKKWAGIVFGTGAGTFATNVDVAWFYDGTICDLGDNDNITDYIVAEAKKKNFTNLDTKEKVWDNLGLYGKWRKLYANNTDQTKMDVYTAAADVVKAIDKYVEDYKKALEEKQSIQNLGKNAYSDAEIAAMPEVKAAQAQVDAVTAKRDAKQNELNDLNAKINSDPYKTGCDAITAKYKEADEAHRVNGTLESLLSGFITSDVDGEAVVASVEEFNDYKDAVIAKLDREVAKAEKDLANKQLLLDEFTAGTYDHIASLKTKVEDVATKTKELEDAQAELDLLKKVYGK